MTDKTEITYNKRGFAHFGDPITCTYGTTARFQESSAALYPRLWMFIEGGKELNDEGKKLALHLDVQQVLAIRDQLNAYLEFLPTRWPGHPELENLE